MARYEDDRYGGDEYVSTRRNLTPAQVGQVQTGLISSQVEEITYSQITANQNDFALGPEFLRHRFTTDASRTITGFANVGLGTKVIVNVGGFDLVLANNSGLSAVENRILTHTGADITLNPGESVQIFYDRTSARVRTIGFV